MSNKKNEVQYSDGQETEEYLRELFLSTNDLTRFSSDLISAIRDWPTEYHLSPDRGRIIDWLNPPPTETVLEIGAGCGAITRALAERGNSIYALEGNPVRAQLCSLRCRDLNNVTVLEDNIFTFKPTQKFDLVLVVGVLEYAAVYCDPDIENPFLDFLNRCREFLNQRGRLVLAIENRLGLKYLAGHLEDHIARPYYGVLNLYKKHEPRTFDRYQLEQLLDLAGFNSKSFFSVYPDYKLPKMFVSDSAFNRADISISHIIDNLYSRTYQVSHTPLVCDETLLRQSLEISGLLQYFGNSFVVIARKEPSADSDRALIHLFNNNGYYTTKEITFLESDLGSIKVRKRCTINAQPLYQSSVFKRVIEDEPYINGEPYSIELKRLLYSHSPLQNIINWVKPWIDLLRQNSRDELLPCDWVDAIPHNLIVDANGLLHYIDKEWIYKRELPISYVLIRGLIWSLHRCAIKGIFADKKGKDCVQMILGQVGLEISEQQFEEAFALEAELESASKGRKILVDQSSLKYLCQTPFVNNINLPDAYRMS